MKNNQKGFSVVEILIVVVIVGLISAVGWLVYDRQQSKVDNRGAIPVTQTSQQEQKTADQNDSKQQENTVQYSIYDKNGVRFEYPLDWKVDNSTNSALIQSPDYSKEGLQAMKINSGAFVEVSQTDIPQKAYTADNFQDWGYQYYGDTKNAKVITVNAQKVVQFEAQHRNGNYGWDSTTTIFFKSDGTKIEVRFGYKVGDRQTHNATYQHVLETINVE
jgi:prepilin-type N-terminal cleavage/methylation domain-containing protein